MLRCQRLPCLGATFVLAILAAHSGPAALADHPQPVRNAVQRLAQELEVLEADVRVVEVEEVTWRDSSLGLPQPGKAYLTVMTPGYRVQLSVAGETFVYHTDMHDHAVLAAGPIEAAKPGVEPPGKMPSEPWAEPGTMPASIQAVADRCRADLAKRLGIPIRQVTVEYVDPVTFRNSALGLPRPNEVVAEVITPGHRLLLEADNLLHVYTAAGGQFRYGGPYEHWFHSLLYLRDGALMQASLLGTNAQQIVSAEELGGHAQQAAISIYPQNAAGGIMVIAQQLGRRPRSELRYLSTDSESEMVILEQTFEDDTGISSAVMVPDSEAEWKVRLLEQGLEFRGAAVSSCNTRWVAFARNLPGIGIRSRSRFDSRHWRVIWGQLDGADGFTGSLVLPQDATPIRLDWPGDEPEAVLRQPQGMVGYRLVSDAEGWKWHRDSSVELPGDELRLSRSETLRLKTTEADGQPAVQVILDRFDGQQTHLATLENFQARRTTVALDKRFAFITGARADAFHFFIVDLASGQVLIEGDSARFGWPIELFGQSPRDSEAILGP